MLANIFTKSVRDRWVGTAIAFVSLMLLLLFAMAIYRNFDVNIYQGMPEAIKNVMGVPSATGAGGLAVSVFLSGAGAWVLAGLAIAAGSSSIASEESNGTIGLLLGNPKSRTNVLLSKAAAMTLLILFIVAASWGCTYLIAAILGVSMSGLSVAALSLHLFAISLFFGFLAMAVTAWTGNRGTAAGVATGVMIVSIFAVGLLPLIKGWEDVTRVFPWYYLNGSQPLFNGVDWAHIGILSAGIVTFTIISVSGLVRRDLKSQNVGVTLLDRLRAYPMARIIITRLAGSARVSGIWMKTFSEQQTLLSITGYVMFLAGILIGVVYQFMPVETMKSLFQTFPQAKVFLAAVGGGDYTTPEGFFQIEVFGLMAPAALMLVAIEVGGKVLSGEESRRTMGLLLASPVPRYRIIAEKSLAMLICALIVGAFTFLGVVAGAFFGRLRLDITNVAATCLLVVLLGTMFGALALAIDAAAGNERAAVFGSIGAALASYVTSSFLPLSDSLAGYAIWSPYHYFLSSNPLVTGMHWDDAAILAGLTAVLVALSVLFFQRRDLREGG